MTISADGSYALVFTLTFLLVSALTLVMCKMFDDTADVVINTSSAAPPFPDAYPQLPPAAAAPMQPTQCVNYCTNFNTGKLEPCYTTKLKQCASERDCSLCDSALPYQKIQCTSPDSWPSVAEAQAKLNNTGDTYCLPTRESCIFIPKNSDGSDPMPMTCASNDYCLRCSDELPSSDAFTCQVVAPNTSVTMTNKDGKSQEYLALPGGMYCLPTTRGCDPRYGTATWTSNEGWKCVCKYPNVFGGDMCNELVACRNNEVSKWAKDKQLLLQNMPGADGSKVGDPWTLDSKIDPNKCVDASNNQVARDSTGKCPTGAEPAVACQCDGIQDGTRATYRNVANDPLSCELDPCFASVNGGRTADDASLLPTIPYQPPTTCACSGAGSRVWEYSPTGGGETYEATGGYSWIGHCVDKQLPGTKIVIKATPSALCNGKVNMEANVSGLVPGQRPPPPDMTTSSKTVDGCVADPCAGNYSDPLYRTTQSIGHFDATAGVCACFKENAPVSPMVSNDFPDCDRTINPVCSSCQDACQGASIDELCPVYPNSINACGNRRCATTPDGRRTCDCGTDCFYYAGMCYPKVPDLQRCEGLKGVANSCQDEGDACMLVNSYVWPTCDPGSKPVQDRATICHNRGRDYCGQMTCTAGGDITFGGNPVLVPGAAVVGAAATSLAQQFFRKWEPCGGKSEARFTDAGVDLTANV